MNRFFLHTSVVIAIGLSPALAVAQSKQECADAYIAGQVARKEGRLREARGRFDLCAKASCPDSLQRDCQPWRAELEHDIPTLAITVTDESGATLTNAWITVDGAPLAASGASPFDPGDHVARIEARGMKAAEQRITLAIGEGRRDLTVHLTPLLLPAPASAPAAATSSTTPIASIVVGGVGVVALGVLAGLGAAGNAKKAELDQSHCKPNCEPTAVSAARSLYVGADVALGVGLGALVTAGILLIVHHTAPSPTASALRFSPSPGGSGLLFQF